MLQKVLKTIRENNMLNTNDKIIVAVSGGPDSMCLLHILNEIKEEHNLTIIAAHLNHCLRGEEADKDEEYVREFCVKSNIDFFAKSVDIHKIAKEKNISSEMAGREERYAFFEQLKSEVGAQKIAIAHNANDQAETVLMRIMRGTGLQGLIGIKPIRDGYYIRPLINSSRLEIEQYCEQNKIKPRLDKTNLENIFSRNKVRLELIPYIESNFNKDIVNTLIRLSDTVRKDNDYLENTAEQEYQLYCSNNINSIEINKEAFKNDEAIISRIIRKALINLTGNLYNYEKVHIYNIIKLQSDKTGKQIMLPNKVVAVNSYGKITLYDDYTNKDQISNSEYLLNINKKNYIAEHNFSINFNVLNKTEYTPCNTNKLIKYFDYDKVGKEITLRYRRQGDKFMPLGMKSYKKISRMFIDLKVPKEERDNIPLICFDEDIAWIVDYRMGEKFKVNSETKKILEIRIEREG